MPIEFRILGDARRILTRCFGHLEGVHLLEYYRSLTADPLYDPTFDELFDLSDVDEVDVTSNDLRKLSHATRVGGRQGRGVRVAIVAPEDLEFGLSRMYEAFQAESANEMRVFRDPDEATKWIDAPAGRTDPS